MVPGSESPLSLLKDQELIRWVRAAAPGCAWTASVCSGAGLYAAAGLLEGKATTTHWGFRHNLRALGIEVVDERVVWQGNHISGAGVSAGIDMALALTARVHGQELAKALQLIIEFDQQPPFDSGSPEKANAATMHLAKRVLLGDRAMQKIAEVSVQLVGARIGRARRALTGGRANKRRLAEQSRD